MATAEDILVGRCGGLRLADGNPHGTSHVAGQGDIPVDDVARNTAAYQGRRVAAIAARLMACHAVPIG